MVNNNLDLLSGIPGRPHAFLYRLRNLDLDLDPLPLRATIHMMIVFHVARMLVSATANI